MIHWGWAQGGKGDFSGSATELGMRLRLEIGLKERKQR